MKERPSIIKKKKEVKEVEDSLKNYNTVIVLDLRNTKDKLLQESRKKLKEKYKAYIRMAKLAVLKRALKNLSIPSEIYEPLQFPSAVIGVNENPYVINKFFLNNMLKVNAKPGQIAEEDIVIEAGETDLTPGPALSQLKQAGLKVKIEKGKIAISETTTLVKKGEKVSEVQAQVLQMLGIKPFKVGLKIFKAYDGALVYSNDVLNITLDMLQDGLKEASNQAFNLSFNTHYYTQLNIRDLLKIELMNAKNVGLNSNMYSSEVLHELLLKAITQAKAFENIEGGKK